MNRWIVAFTGVIGLVFFGGAIAVTNSPQFGEDPDAFQDPGRTQGSNTDPFPSPSTSQSQDFGSSSRAGSSSTQGSSTREGSGTAQVVPFERKFWRYLSANNYKNWAPVPGQTGDFTPSQSPHGALVKMYLNRAAAAANSKTLPVGSVIVKENYGPDRSLMAITVMYKSEGYNPESGDWFWAKYNPNGTVSSSPDGQTSIAGRVTACIECHDGAGGDDFAFFND